MSQGDFAKRLMPVKIRPGVSNSSRATERAISPGRGLAVAAEAAWREASVRPLRKPGVLAGGRKPRTRRRDDLGGAYRQQMQVLAVTYWQLMQILAVAYRQLSQRRQRMEVLGARASRLGVLSSNT